MGNQDIVIIVKIGILAYLLDVLTAKDLYKNCKYPFTNQVELLLHHILFTFSLTAWLSNNKTILIIYVSGLLLCVVHWKFNKNKCIITETIKNDCNIDTSLRTPIKILGLEKNTISFLKNLFYFTVIYSLYKIYYL
jgi:hypothetical protein